MIGVTSTSDKTERWWLIKTDGNGKQVFSKTGRDFWPEEIVEADNGGYVLCGANYRARDGRYAVLFKTNQNGEQEWSYRASDRKYSRFKSVMKTREGDYMIAGNDRKNMWILLFDSAGKEIWSKEFYLPGTITGVSSAGDGGFIIAGRTVWDEGVNGMLTRIARNGDTLWSREYDADGQPDNPVGVGIWVDRFNSAVRGQAGVLFAGVTTVTPENTWNGAWLGKTTDAGDLVWKRIIPGGWANAISGLSSGKYVVAGAYTGKIWLYKIDENGNEAR